MVAEHINGRLAQEKDTNLLWLTDDANKYLIPVAEMVTFIRWRDKNSWVPEAEWQQRADRIIVCWNACHDAGLTTKALDEGVQP